jgi:pectate lyase
VEFYYTIEGATGATVTGLPQGVTGTLKGLDYYISGTVASTVAAGAYKFTVTTTGASKNASKSGTITVTSTATTVPESSSAVESSSSQESSSSEAAPSSSSETSTAIMANVQAPHFTVSVEGRTLSVQGATRSAYLLDAQGKLVAKVNPSGSACSIAVPRAGSYLLRVGNEMRQVNIR